jgi:tripartite ATP-independent transporter DctP family solute receptor
MITKHPSRRGLVRAFVASGVVLGLWAGGAAQAADPVTIRISTPAVPGDWHAEMLNIFEKQVEDALPGRFDVQVFLNATLFKQGAEVTAMQRGNLDMGLPSAQDFSNQIPAWSIFTAGYLIRDPEHQQKVFASEVGEEMYGLVEEQMGIKVLGVAYLGTRQLNLRDQREVSTPADLEGVKLRMPGSDAWQFLGEALGASPTPLAFNEVYLALQTGTIDAQDNPLPTDQKAKFYEVTEQIVLTGHLVDGVFLAISKETWDELDAEAKEIFEQAAAEAIAFNNENRFADEEKLVEFFKNEGLAVTEPDRDAFRQHVQEAYLQSDLSKDWPDGMVERINAIR